MIQAAMHTGLTGMQHSYRNMTEAATRLVDSVSSGPADPVTDGTIPDPATSMVRMMTEERIFTASAKVVSAADGALGMLLDERA